jgi:hypothetical protein
MRYTEAQIKQLEANPNVQRVSETNISFTPAFNLAAVKSYQTGKLQRKSFWRLALM